MKIFSKQTKPTGRCHIYFFGIKVLSYKKKLRWYTWKVWKNKQMKENIAFSIIMPTYNRAKMITKAIDSVLAQTYRNFELIIVDDGSKDKTGDILKEKYVQEIKSNVIKYIYQENGGAPSARNTGLKNAQNEWIAYLDSDNMLYPQFLECFAWHIKQKPNKIYYCGYDKNSGQRCRTRKFNLKSLSRKNYIDTGSIVHHKEVSQELGNWDESLKRQQDWELILRYSKKYRPFFVPYQLYLYNDDEQDASRITVIRKALNYQDYITDKHSNLGLIIPKFKLFKKVCKPTGRCHIYLFGIKILSYKGKRPLTEKGINQKEVEKLIKKFKGKGVENSDRTPKLIVSVTSYPARMKDVHFALYSLLNQTMKPDEVVLWLGEEQFPNKEKDIPKSVLKLKANGLTIKWCHNMRSYTKLIPALKEYPDDIIVTADDDIFYPVDWLEKLYNAHVKNPKMIQTHRSHLITFDEKGVAPYKNWKWKIKEVKPCYLNFLTGVGGVLYPPHCLHKDVLDKEKFQKIAPTQDDIWFWAMAVLNETKINVIENPYTELTYTNLKCQCGGETLHNVNVSQGKNDESMQALLKSYPEITEKIKESL